MTLDQISNLDIYDGLKKRKLKSFFHIKKLSELKAAHYSEKVSKNRMEKSEKSVRLQFIFQGDLSKVDYIGKCFDGCNVYIDSSVGNYCGDHFTSGYIFIEGSAGIHIASKMEGGKIEVKGDVGAFGAANLPGDKHGMKGGYLLVHGSVGERFGQRMRRGFVLIRGNAGNFFCSYMTAGTVLVGGKVGPFAGFGMRRGSIFFAGEAPAVPRTFISANHDFSSFWGLVTKQFLKFGKPFTTMEFRCVKRFVGDRAFTGQAEWFVRI
tara:strand:- start:24433 stop:25227 length:795 start_codon:yes stop_codon:yes gene_type:complete